MPRSTPAGKYRRCDNSRTLNRRSSKEGNLLLVLEHGSKCQGWFYSIQPLKILVLKIHLESDISVAVMCVSFGVFIRSTAISAQRLLQTSSLSGVYWSSLSQGTLSASGPNMCTKWSSKLKVLCWRFRDFWTIFLLDKKVHQMFFFSRALLLARSD